MYVYIYLYIYIYIYIHIYIYIYQQFMTLYTTVHDIEKKKIYRIK